MQADTEENTEGLELLKQPVLALVNLVEFLYLSGPFRKVDEVLDQLTKPVELKGASFEEPRRKLEPYEELVREFEVVKGEKKPAAPLPFIIDEKEEPLARGPAVGLWIKQQAVEQELETINSLLCGPCGCVLCCTGPNSEFDELSGFRGEMKQEFFEVPLEENEADLFDLTRVDTEESRRLTAESETCLQVDGQPFYRHEAMLYHWQNGWSLILPKGSACPRLDTVSRRCLVYEKRPVVCRKPQIFPYILEKTRDTARRSDGVDIPVCMARKKILAIWDCPYVRKYQDEIGAYAEMSGMEPVFKKSKI